MWESKQAGMAGLTKQTRANPPFLEENHPMPHEELHQLRHILK